MTLGQILRAYRKAHNLTLQELADECSLSKAYMSMLENGRHTQSNKEIVPTLSTYTKLAKGMHMSLTSLLEMLPDSTDVSLQSDPKIFDEFDNIHSITTQRLPLLGSIACGKPIFANEERESYVEVGTEIKADFCLRCKGDSMINARIQDGDIVFIKSQSYVDPGEIAVVVIDDEATLKRVFYDQGGQKLVLQAENPKYQPLVYVGEEIDHVHILGKAVAFQSDVE